MIVLRESLERTAGRDDHGRQCAIESVALFPPSPEATAGRGLVGSGRLGTFDFRQITQRFQTFISNQRMHKVK